MLIFPATQHCKLAWPVYHDNMPEGISGGTSSKHLDISLCHIHTY